MPEQRSDDLLKVLTDAGVEFVIVGGLAAIAHGMDRSTKDLDIVANMTVDNMARLLGALQAYQPRHLLRKDLGVITLDSAERLAEFNYILVETRLGRLDVLARVEPVGGFDDIDRIGLELLPGRTVAVISLEQLIQVKQATGRPRDTHDARELEALLELSRAPVLPLDDGD